MLAESEVIRRGIEAFKDGMSRLQSEQAITDQIPVKYRLQRFFCHINYWSITQNYMSYGLLINHAWHLEHDKPENLDDIQVAIWLAREIDLIDVTLYYCNKNDWNRWEVRAQWEPIEFYERFGQIVKSPLYPYLPTSFYSRIEESRQICIASDPQLIEQEKARVRAEMRASTNHGFVYLIQSPTGSYKIGRTKDPDNRMKTFSVKLPFEVDYVCVIELADMYELERDLHRKYASKRVNGEWFCLDPEDIEYIKSLAVQS